MDEFAKLAARMDEIDDTIDELADEQDILEREFDLAVSKAAGVSIESDVGRLMSSLLRYPNVASDEHVILVEPNVKDELLANPFFQEHCEIITWAPRPRDPLLGPTIEVMSAFKVHSTPLTKSANKN